MLCKASHNVKVTGNICLPSRKNKEFCKSAHVYGCTDSNSPLRDAQQKKLCRKTIAVV
jgi:hypothetical protein